MPLVNRFSTTDCGAMTFTGNTLGLLKLTDSQDAGTDTSSIGAYITLDSTLQVPTYPIIPGAGTTLDFNLNESAAVLNLPQGSTVLYAELVWGGQFVSENAIEDNTAFIDKSVKFVTPMGTFSIVPDPITSFEIDTTAQRRWYVRSANVTGLVQAALGGTYSCGGVVGTTDPLDNIGNHAGWTLAVVYFNPNLPVRNMTLFSGEAFVENGTTIDTTVSGFTTPSAGAINARILVSAGEGDTAASGDQMLFGPDTGSLVNLSGPNNPSNNFFGSQINGDSGNLDTSGTYGSLNGNPFAGTTVFAQRQNWDITNVDGSNAIVNNQTSAVVRLTSTNQAYIVNALGIQIDAAPLLEPFKTANRLIAEIGDSLVYTVIIPNSSNADAENVIFTDSLPVGTTFVPGSFIVDGAAIPGANPADGVNIGNIPAFGSVTVSYTVTINEDTSLCGTTLSNQAFLDFEYGCTGQTDSASSNIVNTEIECVIVDAVKTADKEIVFIGDTLTYTVAITNSGNVDVTNVMFVDTIPNGATFIPNTFTINGVVQQGEDPNTGVDLGTISAGASVIVTYMVTVDFLPCPPALVNQATITFDFQLSLVSPIQTRTITSNKLIIEVFPTSFKQLSVDETVKIPCQKPDAQQILGTLVDIVIFNTKVIETIKATSLEGQTLTGFKLIIEGKLNQKVEYVAEEPEQSVHAAHFIVPFSTFIVLPEDFDPNTTIEIEAFIEDIFTKLIDKRTIFKNVTFRLLAKFSSF